MKLALIALASVFFVSIYSLSINTLNGNSISLSAFAGKKILFVNIATSGPRTSQISALQQLQQRYSDSLVIIAFPSNSFGNENKTNSEILSHLNTNYNLSFIVSEKVDVKGPSQSEIFQWLTDVNFNGRVNNPVNGDFYKYLVNEQGELMGVYGSSIDPMSEVLQRAISR